MGKMKRLGIVVFSGIAAAILLGAFLVSIARRAEAAKHTLPELAVLSEADVRPEVWGRAFPEHFARYSAMKENSETTPFGGSLPYSKLLRYPQLTRLWAGYPFAADFNEERSHIYSQVDQMETKRNDAKWLQAHGFPDFKGQPGACMNCHSGWAPSLIRELGWETFNSTPYQDLKEHLEKSHGEGIHAGGLGSTCADCHSPKDMSLRITRPAYLQAMISRGYAADPEKGLVASPQEMRSHVCQQCHVEYYFRGEHKELVFPWSKWPKEKPLRIEMIESHYTEVAAAGVFSKDWVHSESKAPMLKAQHPETELFSSGLHARSGVSCADCHMPYKRVGARKITEHNIRSPLLDVRSSCGACHNQSDEHLRERVLSVQRKTSEQLRATEGNLLALISDIQAARLALENAGLAGRADDILARAKASHRTASFRWDFISSENSTGFHSPQESMRVLAVASEEARRGQFALVEDLAKERIVFVPSADVRAWPLEGTPVPELVAPVGQPPSKSHRDCDSDLENGCL
jgi:nitrite reductase (cytochrome c-552)